MAGGHLVPILLIHLALTGLPGIAATLLAMRRGVSPVPILLGIALAATGVAAMFAFWAYYVDRQVGEAYSYFLLFGSALVAGYLLYERRLDRVLLRQLATPLGLWILGSAFLIFLGFLHGGGNSPIAMSSTRFSGQLPSDNDIPNFFTEWFYVHGHGATAPIYPPSWLASDRPPLQVGYALSQRAMGWDKEGLNYQILGVVLQQLWIIGLWALLVAAKVGRVTRALAMVTVLVSDVAIVNGFFVWPKMLPAALLLAAAALVLTPMWSTVRRSLPAAALVAALLGLAMLGHGSSIFGVIPLILIAGLRGLPGWRWLGIAILVGAVLIVPWSMYQKYGDPPGNRLTKWMLAGVTRIDNRGTTEAILDSYGEAGLGGAIHNKAENFVTLVGGGPMVTFGENAVDEVGSGHFGDAAREIRQIFFFYLFPSLGLLLLAPFAMALGRRRGRRNPAEWNFALTCFAVVVVGSLIWALLLFGTAPDRTTIHVGSLALPVLGFCGAIAGLRATFPRFANWLIGTSALLMLVLYVPSLQPPPGSGYSALCALLAAVCLGGFGVVAVRGGGAASGSCGRGLARIDSPTGAAPPSALRH